MLPTLTLVPALPVAEAEAKVLELLRDNGDCRLPCFWGFTPDHTSVQMIWSFLYAFRDFSLNGVLFTETGGGAGITISRDDLLLQTQLVVEGGHDAQPDIVRWIRVDMTAYNRKAAEGYPEKVFDNPLYAQYLQYYTLPYLLSTYGPPSEAYINFDNDERVNEYYLFLDYTEAGWVAMLTMPMTRSGKLVGGCPAKAFTTLWLWSPEDSETGKQFGFAGGTALKSIEEATSLTLEEFYQQFKDASNTKCLETPDDIYRR